MFSLLCNFYKYCKKRSERKVTLAVLGLDNAGKTTLLNTIKGEVDQETAPTFGFNSSTLQEGKYTLEVFDLGGGKTFRSVWSKYLAEVHAIIYVVDAADAQRFEESKKSMQDVLGNQFMRDKPVLVFANKQDLPTASTTAQVVEGLGLATCRNNHNVVPCTAKTAAGAAVDGRLREGLRWVVSAVDRDYNRLDKRVQAEAEEVRQEEARKKRERDERVRRQREERARLQKEEEERAREVEKENALHDGKGSAVRTGLANGQPEPLQPIQLPDPQQQQQQGDGLGVMQAHLGMALGLPHTIESPGKFPPPTTRRSPQPQPTTSDSAASISDQGTASAAPTVTARTTDGGAVGPAPAPAAASLPPVPGRNTLPPLGPVNLAAARPSSAQSRASAEDGTPAASAAAGFGSAVAAGISSTSLAARPPGSRPASAGRASGGGRSGCSSPRRQGTSGDAEPAATAGAGPSGDADAVEEQAGGGGGSGLALPQPLRPRGLPPLGAGGGSGGGASDSAARGSFSSLVHQNKVVPVGSGLVADVPA